MLRKVLLIALVAFFVGMLVSGPALAQQKDVADIGSRLGPPDFGPLGDRGACDVGAGITDLRVTLQVTHTWVGDLDFNLSHDDTGTSALIVNRPGEPALGAFGCDGDDIDAILFDGALGGDVEDQCAGAVPTIDGEFTPSPDALSAFAGESLSGDWTLTVIDNAGGDTGTLDTWCLAEGTGGTCCSSPGTAIQDNTISDTLALGGGDGEPPVPATSTWGVIALMALFMGVSVYFLRRRSNASA